MHARNALLQTQRLAASAIFLCLAPLFAQRGGKWRCLGGYRVGELSKLMHDFRDCRLKLSIPAFVGRDRVESNFNIRCHTRIFYAPVVVRIVKAKKRHGQSGTVNELRVGRYADQAAPGPGTSQFANAQLTE